MTRAAGTGRSSRRTSAATIQKSAADPKKPVSAP
jgi:hypothetical protein